MSSISYVGGPSAVLGVAAAPLGVAGTTGPSLLPPPSTVTAGDLGDAISQLLLVSSQMSEQQMQSGKNDALDAADKREAASKQRKEALDRAAEAARKAREAAEKGGFLSFITDNIGLTGLAGLLTGNFAIVAADIAAHKAGLTDGSTNVLDVGIALGGNPLAYLAQRAVSSITPEIGSAVVLATAFAGPVGLALEKAMKELTPADLQKSLAEISTVKDTDLRVANKIALTAAMAAVGAAASVATAGGLTGPVIVGLVGIAISTATQIAVETGALKALVGEELAGKIALAGTLTGAGLSMLGAGLSLGASLGAGAGGAATSAAGAGKEVTKTALQHAKTVKQVAAGVTAGTAMLNGADSIVTGYFAKEAADYNRTADHANADAQGARNLMQRIEKLVDQIIEDLHTARESAQRATETLNGALQTHQQTMLQAGSMKV